jgi:hypothetical protein
MRRNTRLVERYKRKPTFEPTIGLLQAMTEPSLFGRVFSASSFWTWRTVAKLIDNISLTEPREIQLFEQCTGRKYNRQAQRAIKRLILLAGRRAGKDRFLSAVAVHRAALAADWRQYQSPGEGSVCILLGRDKKQAAILRRYCRGLLQQPSLAREVVRDTGEVVEFRNGASLEIASNDVSLVRGRSAIAVLGSECCHWKTGDYAASSDEEVVSAAEYSMAMCPDHGLLMLGSSVYRRRGYMFRKWTELHGNDAADALCWFAPSKTMNPKLPQDVVDKAMADDPQKAGAEFNNIWREDMSDCFPLDAIEGSTDFGIHMRPYDPQFSYRAFADPAGGTGKDSFTVAIGHRLHDQANSVVIDALRERKPRFVPRDVIAEYAQILNQYHITEVQGDKFAGGFHADEWKRNGINFVPCERTTSENYLHALPMFLAGRVRLIDNATLRNQLTSLERRISPSGHETVSHPQVASAHDDLATVVCGLLSISAQPGYDLQYRAFEPSAPQRPPQQPQPPEPIQCNAEWWRSMPQSPSTSQDPNKRLRELYGAIDNAIRWQR